MGVGIYEMAQKAIFRSELCVLSQPPGTSRGMMIGVLEVSEAGWEAGLGKRLQSQDPQDLMAPLLGVETSSRSPRAVRPR